jgi:hypothetical protein
MEVVKNIGLGNVAVQRDREKLGQHRDAVNGRINTIADGDVDQTIFAADGHCGFGAQFCQGVQAGTPTAAQNDCQNTI